MRPREVQKREFDVLSKVDHKNVVRLFDIEEEVIQKWMLSENLIVFFSLKPQKIIPKHRHRTDGLRETVTPERTADLIQMHSDRPSHLAAAEE